jgi:hypothetical protein
VDGNELEEKNKEEKKKQEHTSDSTTDILANRFSPFSFGWHTKIE